MSDGGRVLPCDNIIAISQQRQMNSNRQKKPNQTSPRCTCQRYGETNEHANQFFSPIPSPTYLWLGVLRETRFQRSETFVLRKAGLYYNEGRVKVPLNFSALCFQDNLLNYFNFLKSFFQFPLFAKYFCIPCGHYLLEKRFALRFG